MSRDRLRDLRMQQQGGQPGAGYGNAGYGNQQQQYNPPQQQQYNPPQQYAPPPQQQLYGGGGYGGGGYGQQQQAPLPPPVGTQQHQEYPMQTMNGAGPMSMQQFFAEVGSIQDQIKQFHQNINQISEIQSRRLALTDETQQSQSTAALSSMTSQTSQLTNSIRNQIHRLNEGNRTNSGQSQEDFQTKKGQIAVLQNSFKRALEEYNTVEKKSREKYRQRVERQIRIVKPDATQEEVKAAFDDSASGQQIFSQALIQSRQSGARAAFAEVQTRNQDLRKIEETITQLAQMMQDMATLVLEQDESVKQVETNAVTVNQDMEQGLTQTQKAVKSARAARKKRWICFFIILIILAVVGIVVGVEVSKNVNNKN